MISLARLALAAAAVAFAIWLAPASVHIVDWQSRAPVRVALLLPLSRWWLALAATSALTLVIALVWRRRPSTSLRTGRLGELAAAVSPLVWLFALVIPYVPWLADRAPLLLILAGPLRWVLIAAVTVAMLLNLSRWRATALAERVPPTAVIFAISLAIYAACGLRSLGDRGLGGDEPHYLVITQSLLADHDLDITNNHEQRDYKAFYDGPLSPDFLRRGLHEEIYSIHAPGLAVFLLPAFAVAGATGAVLFVALLGALTAAAVFDAARAATGRPVSALAAWMAVSLTVPFVPHAWSIYPEIAGALVVAWAVRSWWTPAHGIFGTAGLGAALAALPWLHTKFIVLLAALVAIQTMQLLPSRRRIATLWTPIAISVAGWLYSFYRMYGEIDPQAPYGGFTATYVLVSNIPRGIAGLLVDQKFGLLIYAPVYALTAAGAWMMIRDRAERRRALAAILTTAAFVLSSTRLYMWWGGASAPARFLVPVLPLLAPMIAIAVERLQGAAGRAAVVGTLAASVAIAVAGVASPREELLFSNPHGVAALAAAVENGAPLADALPTFTEPSWPRSATVVPWLAGLALAGAVAALLVRRVKSESAFWIGTTAVAAFVAAVSFSAGSRIVRDRDAAAVRGRLSLMDAFDPSRFHAVQASNAKRLSPSEAQARTRVVIHAGERVRLPEGRYEAHGNGRITVELADGIILPSEFDLPIGSQVRIGYADAIANDPRAIEIVPGTIVPRALRLPWTATSIERAGGPVPAVIAYVDDTTYPENGVFWTRGTERGTVVLFGSGAPAARVTVHVGPLETDVALGVVGERRDLHLTPNETRDVVVRLAQGQSRFVVTARASRAFRPAEVDRSSDDLRSLGCQIRAQLEIIPN